MSDPAFDAWLADLEHWNFVDEIADEQPHVRRQLLADRVTAGFRAPSVHAAAPAPTLGSSVGSPPTPGPLSLYALTHAHCDTHRWEPATGRLDGRYVCSECPEATVP